MSLFEEILRRTDAESEARQRKHSLKSLRLKMRSLPPTRGFANRFEKRQFGLIAEVKSRSPSMGVLGKNLRSAVFFSPRVVQTAHEDYNHHPAVSAISVLTQASHFGGSPEVLEMIKRKTQKPILRKDFIRSEYEVYFSRFIGADAILLMANVVTDPHQFRDLHDLAVELGMDVLCEVHGEDEIQLLPPTVRLCGINSRKFKSTAGFRWSKLTRFIGWDKSIDYSAFDLVARLPKHCIKVAESGVSAERVPDLIAHGFQAALVGTSLLRGRRDDMVRELDRFHVAIAAAAKSRRAQSATTEHLVGA